MIYVSHLLFLHLFGHLERSIPKHLCPRRHSCKIKNPRLQPGFKKQIWRKRGMHIFNYYWKQFPMQRYFLKDYVLKISIAIFPVSFPYTFRQEASISERGKLKKFKLSTSPAPPIPLAGSDIRSYRLYSQKIAPRKDPFSWGKFNLAH